jgi:hypothetical protein
MGVLKTALYKSTRRVTGELTTAGRGDPLQLGSSRVLQIALVMASLVLGAGPARAAAFTNGTWITDTGDWGSASIDKGSNWLDHTQLATNFSVGTLSIAAGNQLVLDGDRGTNALYVGWLDLSAWGITNASSLTNALLGALNLEGVNLYYDKYDTRNDYLDGQVYEFDQWDARWSLLIPIPESSTWVMIGGAALMFLVLKRKGKGA